MSAPLQSSLPGQLLDLKQEHGPATTTCGAPGNLALVALLLSSALVLLCGVHSAELREMLPPRRLLLAALDVPFTMLDRLCSWAFWTLDWHPWLC